MKRPLMLVLTLVAAALLTGLVVHSVAAVNVPSIDGPPMSGSETPSSATCERGVQESGAKYLICVPNGSSSDLVVYAHGYMAPNRPVEIPQEQMVLGDISITKTVTSLGFAFATTSYYTNGLAVLPALSDLLDLVDIFSTTKGAPNHVYLVGVSEGGLITTLSVEQHPDVYDGGLAMCGPYGDFSDQINHFGDFRVVFDYFFPDLMPGEPLSIPTSLVEDWQDDFFTETIEPAITDPANIISVTQLLTVTDVSPYEHLPPTSTASIKQLLWYNVFATNDGVKKLGGQPFDNEDRVYSGSNNNDRLNDEVTRIRADQAALDEMAANYQTSGELSVPLVTVHTTGDEVVPYRHAMLYREKVASAGNSLLHKHIGVDKHGHCAFDYWDVLGGFITLVEMVENPPTYIYLPLIARTP